MKKNLSILSFVAILALTVMSCGLQVATGNQPPLPPPSPQPGNIQPQGLQQPVNPSGQQPQPIGPQPGQPGPGQPGGGQILSFTSSRTSLNSGECATLQWSAQGNFGANLNGQPVEKVGQQQVCPTTTTTYRFGLDTGGQMIQQEITITVNSGNQSSNSGGSSGNSGSSGSSSGSSSGGSSKSGGGSTTKSATPTFQMWQGVIANLDLAVSNIYPSSTGHIIVTLKNTGNMKISGSYKVVCSGWYTDTTYNLLKASGQYASVNLSAGQTADFDTGYSRNPSIKEMHVSCKVTPPEGDTNSSNNSMDAQVK